MNEVEKFYVKIDEPYDEDPDPDSNCVFLDKEGKYYIVDSMGFYEGLEPSEGWEVMDAVRIKINGRVLEILTPPDF